MGDMYGKDSIHAWFIAVCLMLGLCTSYSVQLNDDVLGLIVFKADLIDPTYALSMWTEDDNSPCNWTGIACDAHSGRVITVLLNGLSLSGHIGRGLGKLAYLQTLSLADNNLSGTIATELAQLTLLKRVDFSHNMLSGPINPALGNLISLKFLDISHNLLSDAIPSQLFFNLKGLHYLSLASNSLGGSIPYTIGSCLGLRTLNLSANHLINAMPSSMGALTGLSVLDVSYNALSGSLPTFAPDLVDIRLQSNKFSGVISTQIGNCILLQHLDLSNNLLSSELPDTMQKLDSLSTLNIAENIIYGNIPSWIGDLSSLKVLNLSYNALYGQIPATIGLLKALESIDFSHNKLSGLIPSSFSSCARLKSMDLSSNKFINTIPDKLLIPGLLSMRLSGNLLAGKLPSVFFNQCGSLQILDLSQNQLSGAVPLMATCAKIEYFNMSNNLLSGNILALHPGSAMVVIDLSHNQLAGNIPASLGDASRLSVLFLDGNKLNGSIPSALGSCSALTDINLSQNNLYGSIPPELGKLKSLEVLDLSYNNLSGTLPSELGQLQRLAELNVSYNQLQGLIPDNGIFVRFNISAFLGNTDLCGANVNLTCPSVMPKPIVLNPNSSDANPIGQNPLGSSQHKHMLLSASAILAISVAAAISGGVVIVSVLNACYAQSILPRSNSNILHSFSPSPSSDMPIGKLVMFTKNSDPRAEEWITTAHALLDKDSELGRGGFGTVYKAVLADGRTVAIKKLMASSMVKSQEDFEKEVQSLGKIKHRNLLGLQGYYWTTHMQLLIYDFIPNGNLYSRLHEKAQSDAPLGWAKRLKIALGIARGLTHLHHACHPQVIHYNIKSSNILLDEHYNPKIADFGLAKLLPMLDKYLMSSKFQSALGYMAPEFACQSLRINEKCDVYGCGVMLLELVTGRRPVEYREDDVLILCDYVRSLLVEGIAMSCVDPNMQDYVEDEVLPVIKLGLICTSQVPSNRPSMAEVVQILELIKTPANSRDLL